MISIQLYGFYYSGRQRYQHVRLCDGVYTAPYYFVTIPLFFPINFFHCSTIVDNGLRADISVLNELFTDLFQIFNMDVFTNVYFALLRRERLLSSEGFLDGFFFFFKHFPAFFGRRGCEETMAVSSPPPDFE